MSTSLGNKAVFSDNAELKVVLDSIQTDLKNLKEKLSELDPTIQQEVG